MTRYASLVRHPGNEPLFAAVEMSVVAALAGRPLHLHAEGLRGTGKTTILRAARDTLPQIERVRDCVYNCRPDRPHCPRHRGLAPDELARLGTERVPMPFYEVSHSAKVGTVVGSIDLAALTERDHPVAALLPGTLPRANRGIIFVDEINRLADTAPDLADVLLDAMGTKPGRVQIEESGLPLVELPVEVTVWAASNPDEDPGPLADIRRQLADRFDLAINMARPTRAAVVAHILADCETATLAAMRPPEPAAVASEGGAAASPFPPAVARLAQARWPERLRLTLADLYVDFGLESLRAVEAMQQAATLHCALAGRAEVTSGDLLDVAPLVLRHRVDLGMLSRITAHLQALDGRRPATDHSSAGPRPDQQPASDQSVAKSPVSIAAEQARVAYQSAATGATSTATGAGRAAPPFTSFSPPTPVPAPAERGALSRLLSRFLGTGQPAPATTGVATGGMPTTGGGQTSGQSGPGNQPPVAAPPHPARSLFELDPGQVVGRPPDAGHD